MRGGVSLGQTAELRAGSTEASLTSSKPLHSMDVDSRLWLEVRRVDGDTRFLAVLSRRSPAPPLQPASGARRPGDSPKAVSIARG
jgi:hypothetical protein